MARLRSTRRASATAALSQRSSASVGGAVRRFDDAALKLVLGTLLMPSLLVVAAKSGGARRNLRHRTGESYSGFGLSTGTPSPLATGLPGYS
jgi:hypothetical protein